MSSASDKGSPPAQTSAPRPPRPPKTITTVQAPTSPADARGRFVQRTGIDPFVDDVVATALAYAASAQMLQVARDLDSYANPIVQTARGAGDAPDIEIWARAIMTAIGPGSLIVNHDGESIDVVKTIDELRNQLCSLKESGRLLAKAVGGLTAEELVGAVPHRFVEKRRNGRPQDLGRAKFVRRLSGAWKAAGRTPLTAEDYGLLAVAVGMDPIPATVTGSNAGSSAWEMAIGRWRAYVRAHRHTDPQVVEPANESTPGENT